MNRLKKQIFKAFEMTNRCYDGPDDTSSGGKVDDDVANADVANINPDDSGDNNVDDGVKLADDGKGDDGKEPDLTVKDFEKYGIHPSLVDDPDTIENVKDLVAQDKKAQEEAGKDKNGGDNVDDKDNDKDKDKGDDATPDDKAKDDGKKKDGEDDQEFEFTEDVDIGGIKFTKEELKETPLQVLKNFATIKSQLDVATADKVTAENTSSEILNDPIVKERIDRINDGRGDEPYSYYAVSKQTEKYIIDKVGLDPGIKEDKEIIDGLYEEIGKDFKDNVGKAVNNTSMQNDKKAKQDAQAEKGMENLLAVQEFLPEDVRIKEKNIEKLFKLQAKHPDWENFTKEKGLGKVQDELISMGFKSFNSLSKMDPKVLYSMAAAKLGWPVAFNTKSRDDKMLKDEKDNILKLFNPKMVAKGLGKSGKKASSKDGGSVIDGTMIDVKKLGDPLYIQGLYDKAKTGEIFKIQADIQRQLEKANK